VEAIRAAHWLVAGLGNPGPAYAGTRHNVGFRVVERLAAEARVRLVPEVFQTEAAWANESGAWVLLVKPQAFMNLSGPPVASWLSALELPVEKLVVIHDDLDLPLGRLRLTGGAGSGGHRGVASIQAALGTKDFPRVRLGIGRPDEQEDAADRVLGEFLPEERPLVEEMVGRAAAAVQSLMGAGLAAAMARYNVRVMPEADASP
jgi:peptidyl-tRNA hydrolase, PTH1 family